MQQAGSRRTQSGPIYLARWLAFCVSNAMTRSTFHFFPSVDNVSAPYPVNCTLSMFGSAGRENSVVLEGGRLGSPDGVRLEDAFPEMKGEMSGIFGLSVELECSQQRMNMAGSACVVEISSQGITPQAVAARGLETRFWPKLLPPLPGETLRQMSAPLRNGSAENEAPAPMFSTGIALKDPAHNTSIIAVNSGDATVRLLCSTAALQEGTMGPEHEFIGEIPARAVSEFALGDKFFEQGLAQECSWGNLRARSVDLQVEAPALQGETSQISELLAGTVACYLVYRDAGNRRITAVTAL